MLSVLYLVNVISRKFCKYTVKSGKWEGKDDQLPEYYCGKVKFTNGKTVGHWPCLEGHRLKDSKANTFFVTIVVTSA